MATQMATQVHKSFFYFWRYKGQNVHYDWRKVNDSFLTHMFSIQVELHHPDFMYAHTYTSKKYQKNRE